MFGYLARLQANDEATNGIGARVEEMLLLARQMLLLVTEPLFSDGDLAAAKDELYALDRRINRLEQDVRREVYDKLTRQRDRHFSFLLILFSIVKDAERCGDYAKNVYDVLPHSGRMRDDERCPVFKDLRDRVAGLLGETGAIFRSGDTRRAREFLRTAHEATRLCDTEVTSILTSPQSPRSAAYGLLFRFHKRMLRHIMNIVSSVVMPLDKLDFFDEERRDEMRARGWRLPFAAGL